jgi:hypothetical protein
MKTKLTQMIGVAARGASIAALAGSVLLLPAATASAAIPPIKHVFVLIEENEAFASTFGPGSAAPYLSQTLVSQGAFVPNYYGVGHASLDNYIAMVSGQAPNPKTQGDCPVFSDFPAPTSMDANGQETGQGCVYPADVPTLMSQLETKGLSWRAYMDGMGANPLRESATCGHPAVGAPDLTEAATPTDQYATRHDPFVYFHSVIDNPATCSQHVVNLSQLQTDLASASTTPNFVFITPSLCNDGHDPTGANCPVGSLPAVDAFLKTWVPRITSSPAYQQDGLLIVTFDESVGDATACCGEVPGPSGSPGGVSGPGGGVVGAVMLSPFIAPGTKTTASYNHYSMLGSVEDIFGLARLADAKGTTAFGSDVFTRPPVAPQDSGLKLKPASFSAHKGTTISYSDTQAGVTKLTVERLAPGSKKGRHACKVLKAGHKRPKHTKACTVTKVVGSFIHTDTAGANSFKFNGRLHGHPLAAGAYVLQASPALNGLTGKTITAHFHVT